MKSIVKSGISFLLILLGIYNNAQTKKETAKVSGVCSMCKARIEKASNDKNTTTTCDVKTNILTLVYDSSKTSKKEILRKIAEAGHDNEMFYTSDASYKSLPECCLYQRTEPSVKK